jgi:glycosyltransferase A (GT-A) superfamily protein (DUF2064 family)
MILLAKVPVPGHVKTRLCPPATPEQASDVATAALLDTLETALGLPGVRVVVVLDGDLQAATRADGLKSALYSLTMVQQRNGTLGARIAAAYADTAAALPGLPTLLLGMDTPQADGKLIADAFALLAAVDGPDAVLGPATDGGWWALGLREPRWASELADIPTSRWDTGLRTLVRLQAKGLRVELLPELTDVDTTADGREVACQIPDSRFAAAMRLIL